MGSTQAPSEGSKSDLKQSSGLSDKPQGTLRHIASIIRGVLGSQHRDAWLHDKDLAWVELKSGSRKVRIHSFMFSDFMANFAAIRGTRGVRPAFQMNPHRVTRGVGREARVPTPGVDTHTQSSKDMEARAGRGPVQTLRLTPGAVVPGFCSFRGFCGV